MSCRSYGPEIWVGAVGFSTMSVSALTSRSCLAALRDARRRLDVAHGFHHRPQLRPRLLECARLQSTIGIGEHLFGIEHLESLQQSLAHLLRRFDDVRVRVEHTISDLLRELVLSEGFEDVEVPIC